MKRTYSMTNFKGRDERRTYKSRRAADAYATKHGLTIVDSWPVSDPPPRSSDATEWDAYRTRHGYAGGR